MEKHLTKKVHNLVANFKTKNKEGFTNKEIRKLVAENFPNVTKEQFYEKLGVNTCMVIDGEVVTYHCDVETALICLVEGREKNIFEWD